MQAWIVSLLALTGTSLAAPTYSYTSSSYSSDAYYPAATGEYSNDWQHKPKDDYNNYDHGKHDQYQKDVSIKVILTPGYGQPVEVPFENAGKWREEKWLEHKGPFKTVELALGKDFEPQTLRCQILDKHQKPIVVVRGENIDTTFADGDKGLWTFKEGEKEVTTVICNPAFVADPQKPGEEYNNGYEHNDYNYEHNDEGYNGDYEYQDDKQDTAVLVKLTGDYTSETSFFSVGVNGGAETLPPKDSFGPFNGVQLTLGKDVKNQALRCRLTDKQGAVIVLKRGESIQNTFASGNPWTFLQPEKSEVGKIECNDKFVLGSQ